MDIAATVERTIDRFCKAKDFTTSLDYIEAVLDVDRAARETANDLLKAL